MESDSALHEACTTIRPGTATPQKEFAMAQHARPHLTTHHRDKNHSAVAGAAYRLGLNLFDERTGTWHTYGKRAGVEVVFGDTIGPKGTPKWLLDPGTLWNQVEQAEVRFDAQIGRDFRIPIPLGLTEDAAIEMGRAMASFIVDRYNVPVSFGVHKDNATDLDGVAKPKDKVGFHVHCYFPTRAFLSEGEGEGAVWRLGPKLRELSNHKTSGAHVEALNRAWAELANRFAAAAGQDAKYEWKSYARLNLDIKPKPERARRFGAANHWHRKPAEVTLEGIVLTPGLRREKKLREKAATRPPLVVLDGLSVRQRLAERRAVAATRGASMGVARAKAKASQPIRGKAPMLNRVRLVGGRTLRLDHHLRLAELMRRAGAAPRTDAEAAALERSMFLADLLESLLFAMERSRQVMGDFAIQRFRREMALNDARTRQDIVDRDLRRAEQQLERWQVSHPLRAQLRRASGEYTRLVQARDRAAARSERMQGAVCALTDEVAVAWQAEEDRKLHEARAQRAIREAMGAYKPDFRSVANALMGKLTDVQRADLTAIALELGVEDPDTVTAARADAPFVAPRKPN